MALELIIRNHKGFAQPIMDLWFKLPKDQRRSDHTVTYDYTPPAGVSMSVRQGGLTYKLTRLSLVVAVKIGEAPLNIGQVGYGGMRVAHGQTTIPAGGSAGQAVRFVMTEQRVSNRRPR